MKQGILFNTLPDGNDALRDKNGVRYTELSCKSILNYCDTYRMPDTFTINPYRGCEFGCAYCYARYTHEFMELDWEEFEKKIYVKSRAAAVLLRTLDSERIGGRHIALGTATDPYQPAESRFKVTQELLRVFSKMEGLSLSITTKSSLLRRDIPLLQEIAGKNTLRVNISLISLDEELLSDLEPKASRAAARLEALRQVTQAGIRAGILLMPVLPGLTDSPQSLESVVRAARLNGAHYLFCNVVFLRESSRKVFYEFLFRTRPQLYRSYRKFYQGRVHAPGDYRAEIKAVVERLKEKYGFEGSPRGHPKTIGVVRNDCGARGYLTRNKVFPNGASSWRGSGAPNRAGTVSLLVSRASRRYSDCDARQTGHPDTVRQGGRTQASRLALAGGDP